MLTSQYRNDGNPFEGDVPNVGFGPMSVAPLIF